jgi:hypothetical protein
MTERGMVAICRHFADHLEDIAIAASPMDIDSDDDSDAGSMKSHGHFAEEKDKLQTIAEDDEEISEAELEKTRPGADVAAKTTGTVPPCVVHTVAGYIYPDCAICGKPKDPEREDCACEDERLAIAVQQAESRGMDDPLGTIRKVSSFMLNSLI